jgi:secreted trypsin-like serine protease
MKFLVLLIAFVAAAAAENIEVDWSMVKPIREMPGFWDNKPAILQARGKSYIRDRRIVNGEIATPHQFPYQAGLLMSFPTGTGLCGGAFIGGRTILTAAHCVDSVDMSQVLVILGAHFLTQIEPNQQRQAVARGVQIVVHPEWTPDLIRQDIAIVHLNTAAIVNAHVQPIRRAVGPRTFENDGATVSGWGRFSDSLPQASDVLRFYRGTILSMANCRLRFPGVIMDNNICLSGLNNGGACQGDSGGPLTYHDAEGSLHIGVVSFGLALGCEALWPSVFARTSSFETWINANSV